MKYPFKTIRYHYVLYASALLVICGVAGLQLFSISFAQTSYTHNPFGNTDYCALENNTTVLYGWAHDTDAPAGSQPNVVITAGGTTSSVPTDRSGYRDAPINDYITHGHPGMPTSSVYGWRLPLAGLYKGGSYAVSGTISNVGAGSSAPIEVNTSHHVDNDTSKAYFSGGKIPQSCLATAPAAPAPAPKPTPKKTVPKTPTPTPAPPIVTSMPNASVSTGTKATALKIPADSASSVRIAYGTSPDKLDLSSSETPTKGEDVTITLNKLKEKTVYHYQVVRTINGAPVASTTASFTTPGYSLVLTFSDGTKNISGVSVSLDSQKTPKKSDKNGSAAFGSLGAGPYKVTYVYNGKTHTLNYNSTTSAETEAKPAAITIRKTIYLEKPTSSTLLSSHSSTGRTLLWIVVVFGLLLFIGFIWYLVRRRKRSPKQVAVTTMPPPMGTPAVPPITSPQAAIHTPTHRKHTKQKPLAPPVEDPSQMHIGVSLRDLVLQSMAEEAKKKNRPK
jgi:hypothetical protein